MLARHLLFLATRRPHNSALLSFPCESLHSQKIGQPPPYVGPPLPGEHDAHKCKERNVRQERNYAQDERKLPYGNDIYSQDLYHRCHNRDSLEYCRGKQYFENDRVYGDYKTVQMRNARNQGFSVSAKENDQQFYTLPTRKVQREIEPPRSITPDITRGLGRGSLSAMHMLARHGQKLQRTQDIRNSQLTKDRIVENHEDSATDVRNRFASPLSLTAFGHRFFASSPINESSLKSTDSNNGTNPLRHNPISPIARNIANVGERLTSSGSASWSSPTAVSSCKSTPNLILSPTKSTMSNEELFAAIHKSKKRLNIKEENENVSSLNVETGYLMKSPAGSRHSWSPESLKPIQSAVPASATSRLDFKRLLLQQSVRTGPSRVSAAEQLKMSRQQCQQQQTPTQQAQLAKILSPRSAWRFQTPRTDVLSSTIMEDTAAEEKAMKPSPENTSPVSKISAVRRLDLSREIHHPIASLKTDTVEKLGGNCANSSLAKSEASEIHKTPTVELVSRKTQFGEEANCKEASSMFNDEDKASRSNVQYSVEERKEGGEEESQTAQSAFESRRLSNQLARAQFLASTPISTSQDQASYFRQRFRARSESPQHAVTRNVTRSPSVPTLETAL